MRVVNSRHTWTRGGWSLESGPRVIPGTNGGASGHHVPTSLTPWPASLPLSPSLMAGQRIQRPTVQISFVDRSARVVRPACVCISGPLDETCLESPVALASCSRTASAVERLLEEVPCYEIHTIDLGFGWICYVRLDTLERYARWRWSVVDLVNWGRFVSFGATRLLSKVGAKSRLICGVPADPAFVISVYFAECWLF